MEVVFFDQPRKDIEFWKKSGQKKIMTRITNLLNDIQKHAYSGIGKPEELKHDLSGWWSRRINREHRLIYRVVNGQPAAALETAEPATDCTTEAAG